MGLLCWRAWLGCGAVGSVFACLLALAVEGIAMYAVFAYVERRFTRWAFRSAQSAAG